MSGKINNEKMIREIMRDIETGIRETEKMEKLFCEVWRDNNDKFGLNKPYHWHEVKKE